MEDLVNTGVRRAVALVCFNVFDLAEAAQVADDVKTFRIIKVCEVLCDLSYRKTDRDIGRLLDMEGRQNLNHEELIQLGDVLSHRLIERFNRCCQLYTCEGEVAGQLRTQVLRMYGQRIVEWVYHARQTRRIHMSKDDRHKSDEVRDKKRMLSWSQPDAVPSVAEIRGFLLELDDDDEGVGPAAAAAAAADAPTPAAPAAAPVIAPAAGGVEVDEGVNENGEGVVAVDIESGDELNPDEIGEAVEAGNEVGGGNDEGVGGGNAEDGEEVEDVEGGEGN